MTTIQIAQRLVRTFSEGGAFRQVVTETIGEGKTLTKVLDKNGNVITERLKVITPKEQVGDKFVKTTTKIVKGKIDGNYLAGVHKFVKDRVYNEAGQKLGQRIKSFVGGILEGKNIETKNKWYLTSYEDGIRDYMKKQGEYIPCNGKGLPLPSKNIGFGYGNASLKAMRTAFQEKYPGYKYAPPNFSFASLDEHLPDAKLTDLEHYL